MYIKYTHYLDNATAIHWNTNQVYS